jgi:hypothetical protein
VSLAARLADRAIASLLIYEARSTKTASLWAPAVEAWAGLDL